MTTSKWSIEDAGLIFGVKRADGTWLELGRAEQAELVREEDPEFDWPFNMSFPMRTRQYYSIDVVIDLREGVAQKVVDEVVAVSHSLNYGE